MRTVTDTAQKMTTLMSKLSLKSFKPMPVAMPESIDMSNLIDETVAPIRGAENVRLSVSGEPVPPVMAVREHIHQVLLNVVLNAKQAIGEKGDISIAIKQSNGSVVVTVDDTGSGIPSSMLESLFRPSQSSRPGGLGSWTLPVQADRGGASGNDSVAKRRKERGHRCGLSFPFIAHLLLYRHRFHFHVLNM